MFYREEDDRVAGIVKANAIVANTQSVLGRLDVPKAFHIAFANADETCQRVQDAQSRRLVDCAELCAGLVTPGNLLAHLLLAGVFWVKRGLAHALEISC